MTEPTAWEPVVITKDRNGRLHDPENNTDVTLEDLARMVRDNTPFVVRDSKSGDDVTCAALAAVIIGGDSHSGPPMLPVRLPPVGPAASTAEADNSHGT